MGERADIARSGTARTAWWAGGDPATELQHLWGEVSRLLERSSQTTAPSRHWMPLVEEEDSGDSYLVRAELPGIPRERVSVEVDDRELHIHGTVEESMQGNALRRRSGSFSYGIRIPGDVNTEGVRADLRDGVLTVRLPKTGTSTRRTITVDS
ncbi:MULTISPECIES: Hsp20/alpha crystallin family protein [Streptomyces]|uniref:Hsp20/alpha crystallin family protein n=1 Tax=Streptomyces dengpaensis TaxID=2049881 RepID=A0ABN5HUQ7_9ACTN|nr:MULTISPECIES: Hsp20/alpha crystallin family protein [Streptomyces]AVH54865.1 Hsp20/alpha crystallin family protein [Streptomyces dengpaensis]PIB03281.1 heat-shock protein Hsp20 [Streptomyces sp. HG99]